MSKMNSTQYKMLDGKIFEASSPTALIQQMRADSKFGAGKDLNDFMVNVSVGSYEYNHSNIRMDPHENFLADLMTGDFVEIIEETN